MAKSTENSGNDQDEPGSSAASDPDIPPEPAPRMEGDSSPKDEDANVDGTAAVDISVAVMPGANDSIDVKWLSRKLSAAMELVERPIDRIGVLIVDDARMINLHRQYTGVSGTTDVLTFPASQSGEPIDADIAVCVDEAIRQATDRGHPAQQELLLYSIHGVLHCAGYDDHVESDYLAMHAEEDRILRALGFSSTFQDGRRSQEGPRP